MQDPYDVVVESGALRSAGADWSSPHRWTSGVAVHGPFTGAHLLHAAIGGCVLNDVHREAAGAGLVVDGVRVTVSGGFDPATWTSTGVEYRVEVASGSDPHRIALLLDRVERIAEIPRAVVAGVAVRRVLDA